MAVRELQLFRAWACLTRLRVSSAVGVVSGKARNLKIDKLLDRAILLEQLSSLAAE